MEELNLTEQEQVRREKLAKYIEKGLDPFGKRYDRDSWSADLKEQYGSFTHEEMEEKQAYYEHLNKWIRNHKIRYVLIMIAVFLLFSALICLLKFSGVIYSV